MFGNNIEAGIYLATTWSILSKHIPVVDKQLSVAAKYVPGNTKEIYVWQQYISSTGNATPPKSTKSRDSNSSVQVQIQPRSQSEFVPQDSEKCEFLDLVDFCDAEFHDSIH